MPFSWFLLGFCGVLWGSVGFWLGFSWVFSLSIFLSIH